MSQPPSLPPKPESSSQNTFTLSDTFRSLPTSELEKLISSITEIRGYLLKDVNLDGTVEELTQVITQMKQYIKELESLEESKQQTNEQLAKLEDLNQQWQALQTEMLKQLDRKFSIDTLFNSLLQLVNTSRQTCESLSSSFINSTEPHNDASIESFISTYKKERSLYHLRNSKLQRFKENRIGGLYL